MPYRTQIVCLHEGKKGRSVDPVFINSCIKKLNPRWLRPFKTGKIRMVPCGSRGELVRKVPDELHQCIRQGADTTLMVIADVDKEETPENLKQLIMKEIRKQSANLPESQLVFIMPKRTIENWIQFLLENGSADSAENSIASHHYSTSDAAKAGQRLAELCQEQSALRVPDSLAWSCQNWHALVTRMQS